MGFVAGHLRFRAVLNVSPAAFPLLAVRWHRCCAPCCSPDFRHSLTVTSLSSTEPDHDRRGADQLLAPGHPDPHGMVTLPAPRLSRHANTYGGSSRACVMAVPHYLKRQPLAFVTPRLACAAGRCHLQPRGNELPNGFTLVPED